MFNFPQSTEYYFVDRTDKQTHFRLIPKCIIRQHCKGIKNPYECSNTLREYIRKAYNVEQMIKFEKRLFHPVYSFRAN